MIATLSGKTTREQLEREMKDGLVGLLAAYGNGIDKTAAMRLAKKRLVDSLMALVGRMARDEEAKAAAAEAARQQTLAAEKAAGKVHAALENLLRSVNHVVDAAKKTIAEFQAEVARGHYAILCAIAWHAEGVLKAFAVLRHFDRLQAYLVEQIEQQERTAAEIAAELQKSANETLRRCLEEGYRHNSTNALDNINNLAEFAATQAAAKFFRQAVKAWKKALEDGDVTALGCIRGY